MKMTLKILALIIVFQFTGINANATTTFDQKPTSEVHIYPNPASNFLKINYQTTENYAIVISNILGVVVYKSETLNAFENSTMLNLADLGISNGIYLVKIYEGVLLKATQKLIVKR